MLSCLLIVDIILTIQPVLRPAQSLWMHLSDLGYQFVEKEINQECPYYPPPEKFMLNGEVYWQVHVDRLSVFESVRELTPEGGLLHHNFDKHAKKATEDRPCRYNHDPAVCKCDMVIIHVGQGTYSTGPGCIFAVVVTYSR